jgi:transposase InsO family protein
MTQQGCGPLQAVMSDNHKAYTSHRFQALLRELGARHIPTPPYTPRWNGKVERFHRTLNDEWARSRIWPNLSQAGFDGGLDSRILSSGEETLRRHGPSTEVPA